MPTKEESLLEITDLIKNSKPFQVVRFNDGEWNAMTGHMGANCDNHRYLHSLKTSLTDAWRFLATGSTYISYYIPEAPYEAHQELYKQLPSPENWVHQTFCAHEENSPKELLHTFYKAIAESVQPKIFVGPKRLQTFQFLNIQSEVRTPLLDACTHYESVSDTCKRIASNVDRPMFLMCCGFLSCLVAADILKVNPNATIIDLGSSLDPLYVGPTRKNQLTQEEARQVHPGISWPVQPHFYTEIPGWFNYQDLYELVVHHFPEHAKFVEIGCWQGKSASFLATEIVRSGKKQTLDCIDHFKGSKDERDTHHADAKKYNIRGLCCNNLRPFWITGENKHWSERKDNIVRVLPFDHHAVVDQYRDKSLDFVFIDAGHSYKEVKEDIEAWLPKVKYGGWLAGHDYNSVSFPGVKKAVDLTLPNVIDMGPCWVYKHE